MRRGPVRAAAEDAHRIVRVRRPDVLVANSVHRHRRPSPGEDALLGQFFFEIGHAVDDSGDSATANRMLSLACQYECRRGMA